ncbi:hypothetical protein BD408DRAFT_434444 [Parasitella parasitica]|nr:hypothetical protein BD408DRAFT_434444 [Parasitella parasitica]
MCHPHVEYTLPEELWAIIFQEIRQVEDLARFRLVCQLWNPLAERALFGQDLDLTTADKITKLLYHLNRKPHMARYIKFMQLSDTAPSNLQKRLLDRALTPNIKYLTGRMRENVFGHLLDILQHSAEKFSKLQVLPNFPDLCRKRNPTGIFVPTSKYGKVLLYFKETLKQLRIQIRPCDLPQLSESVILRLHEFQNLTFLALDLQIYHHDELGDCLGLDYILSKCPTSLETLQLHWEPRFNFMEKEDFKSWLKGNNVEQAPNLRELKIARVSRPHSVEYLLYKYPNVLKLAIGSLNCFSDRIVDELKNISLFLVIDHLHGLSQFYLENNSIDQFTNFLCSFKSTTTNTLQISKGPNNLPKKEMFYVEKSIDTGSTLYGLTTCRYNPLGHKELSSLTGLVSSFRVCYDNHVGQRLGEELCELYKIVPFNIWNNLVYLELSGDRKISQAILNRIDHSSVSNLKYLTIGDCFCPGEDIALSFPQIELEMVSFVKLPTCRERCPPRKTLLITKQTSASQESCYFLTAGTPSRCEQIDGQIISEDHENVPVIRFSFKSLNRLYIKLEDHIFDTKASIDPTAKFFSTLKQD